MRKKSRWLVLVGLVLALVLALAPTQVLAEPDNAVDPNGPYTPPVGGTFTVDINVDYVTKLDSGQFKLLYDETVIDVINIYADVRIGGLMLPGTTVTPDKPAADPGTLVVLFNGPGAGPAAGVTGSGTIIEIDFTVMAGAQPCDTSILDLSSNGPDGTGFNGLWNSIGVEQAATWGDSSVEIGPCQPIPPPVVVSGKELPGTPAPGVGEWPPWDPPGPPPGYEPCDEFMPCEIIYVWGYGDPELYCQWYRIWIQPYVEGVQVYDGQPIDPDAVPPGFVPIEVHIDEDGKFGPVPIWHVDGEYCELWEIVADKFDPAGEVPYQEGIYNSDEDGLDAAATDAWGFHIYPEGLTIILLSLGLVAVGGYLVVRRRKGAQTDS